MGIISSDPLLWSLARLVEFPTDSHSQLVESRVVIRPVEIHDSGCQWKCEHKTSTRRKTAHIHLSVSRCFIVRPPTGLGASEENGCKNPQLISVNLLDRVHSHWEEN